MTRRYLFVVGASRSGTTLVGKMFGRLEPVFTFEELHFFEGLWSGSTDTLSQPEAARLVALLMQRQRNGLFRAGSGDTWLDDAAACVAGLAQPTAPECYRTFLLAEAAREGKSIPCDQTPRNVFWLAEILSAMPEARIIVMIRDPRDVLLSQKYKWRRGKLGGTIPRSESLRSWLNYHPLVMGKLWQAAADAASHFADDSRVKFVRFEDLVAAPEQVSRDICAFAGIDWAPGMLAVPQVGSSHRADKPGSLGIDSSAAGNWRRGDLSAAEVALCECAAARGMAAFGYTPSGHSAWRPGVLLQLLILPVKFGLALLANARRFSSFLAAFRRRVIR